MVGRVLWRDGHLPSGKVGIFHRQCQLMKGFQRARSPSWQFDSGTRRAVFMIGIAATGGNGDEEVVVGEVGVAAAAVGARERARERAKKGRLGDAFSTACGCVSVAVGGKRGQFLVVGVAHVDWGSHE